MRIYLPLSNPLFLVVCNIASGSQTPFDYHDFAHSGAGNPMDRIKVVDQWRGSVFARILNGRDVWPFEIGLPDTATGIYVVRMSRAGEVVASELFSKL